MRSRRAIMRSPRVFIARMCGSTRTNGCRAPIRYDGLEYWCILCDALLDHHPRDPRDTRNWYVLQDGQTDQYSEILRIMEP